MRNFHYMTGKVVFGICLVKSSAPLVLFHSLMKLLSINYFQRTHSSFTHLYLSVCNFSFVQQFFDTAFNDTPNFAPSALKACSFKGSGRIAAGTLSFLFSEESDEPKPGGASKLTPADHSVPEGLWHASGNIVSAQMQSLPLSSLPFLLKKQGALPKQGFFWRSTLRTLGK